MIVRIKLAVEQEEYSGLLKLALSEMRNPESQLRYLLRQELERLGLLFDKDNRAFDVNNLQENLVWKQGKQKYRSKVTATE